MSSTLSNQGTDIQILERFLKRVVDLAHAMTNNISYKDDDHFAFMTITYLYRQLDHAESIAILKSRMDSQLIVRSMLEGLCQLLWAGGDKQNRALLWRHFALIHDWRLIKETFKETGTIDQVKLREIEERLKPFNQFFFTEKALKMNEKGQKLPDDPYIHNWSRLKPNELFEAVKGNLLHDYHYSDFSEWHHWDPAGIAKSITRDENVTTFVTSSDNEYARVLALAFQCVVETLGVFNEHCNRNEKRNLDDLINEFVKWHTERGVGPASHIG